MFQDISESLVLIAFVWGPLVYAREHNGRQAGSPLRAHAFSNCGCEGVMMIISVSMYNGLK